MRIKRLLNIGLCMFFLVSIVGCGQDLPFEYQYLSANTVQIKYQGQDYMLSRSGSQINTPFEYEFEPDGDLDILVDGKRYDIDSPYDLDKPKTTKKRVAKKKTTTKKTTKKKRK